MGVSMSPGLPRLLLILGVLDRKAMVMIRLRLLAALVGSRLFGISLISMTGMRFIGRSSFALGPPETMVGFRPAPPGRLSSGVGFARVLVCRIRLSGFGVRARISRRIQL